MQDWDSKYKHDNDSEENPNFISLPSLCTSCLLNNEPSHEIQCNLTRIDQKEEKVFVCFAYKPVSPEISREEVLRDLCLEAGIEYED